MVYISLFRERFVGCLQPLSLGLVDQPMDDSCFIPSSNFSALLVQFQASLQGHLPTSPKPHHSSPSRHHHQAVLPTPPVPFHSPETSSIPRVCSHLDTPLSVSADTLNGDQVYTILAHSLSTEVEREGGIILPHWVS